MELDLTSVVGGLLGGLVGGGFAIATLRATWRHERSLRAEDRFEKALDGTLDAGSELIATINSHADGAVIMAAYRALDRADFRLMRAVPFPISDQDKHEIQTMLAMISKQLEPLSYPPHALPSGARHAPDLYMNGIVRILRQEGNAAPNPATRT
jgi:hypothetical protein